MIGNGPRCTTALGPPPPSATMWSHQEAPPASVGLVSAVALAGSVGSVAGSGASVALCDHLYAYPTVQSLTAAGHVTWTIWSSDGTPGVWSVLVGVGAATVPCVCGPSSPHHVPQLPGFVALVPGVIAYSCSVQNVVSSEGSTHAAL